MKKLSAKKSKSKAPISHFKQLKSFKKAWKEKKKKWQRDRQEKKNKDFGVMIPVNATNTFDNKKKKSIWVVLSVILAKKKRHYFNKCPKHKPEN